MKVIVEMSEIPQTSTSTEPNEYKIELVAIGSRRAIEIYFDFLRDNPENEDVKENSNPNQ